MSSTTGSKLAGTLTNYISNDTIFIFVGVLAAIPLVFLLGINADKHPFQENS
jgi:hypothetical protein